jgi:hypothetical protein
MTASIVSYLIRKEKTAPAPYPLAAFLINPRDSSTRSAATESPVGLGSPDSRMCLVDVAELPFCRFSW